MGNSPSTDQIRRAVDAALAELGAPDLDCLGTRFLLEDGFCVGQRFLFEGLEADWTIAEQRIDFFDDEGRVVKSVELDVTTINRAA